MLPCLLLLCINLSSRVQADAQEVNLINQLNQFYLFDHNVFVLESPMDVDRFFNVTEVLNVPRTLYVIENIAEGIKSIEAMKRISSNPFMIIVMKSIDIELHLNFMKKIKNFQRINIDLKIGMFVTDPLPNDHIEQLFRWCWLNSIVNIFVSSKRSNSTELIIYKFNPFGTFDLINQTEKRNPIATYFPRTCYNLRQHPIRIAVHNDLNTFIYSADNPNFGGADGKLWQTVFGVVNASYFMVKFINVTDGHVIQDMAKQGEIDLGPQTTPLSNDEPIYLYPIYMDNVVVVVPSAKPYAEFIAYLQTFINDNSFNVSLVTIPVLIVALTFIRYFKRKKILFCQSVADVVNLFMYDNLAIDYRNLHRVESFIILPLTLAGFVIINVLLSILTSYLTRPMDQPEINTHQDIERSPFPVLAPTKKNMDQMIHMLKHTWHVDWTDKMASTSTLEEYFHQILSFNTSMCFIYFGSKVKNLLEHQKRLNIRGFRIPSETISQTVFGYVVSADNPLKDCFNEIIQWIMNAGLYWKWIDESYYEFVEKGFFSETVVNAAKGGTEKYYVPIFIVYGWIGSVLVFSTEIVWHRIKRKMVQNRAAKRLYS